MAVIEKERPTLPDDVKEQAEILLFQNWLMKLVKILLDIFLQQEV